MQKAINSLVVDRNKRFPTDIMENGQKKAWDRISYRGAGIDKEELDFWTEGLQYRAPAPIATSIREEVSNRFLPDPTRFLEPVRFVFQWDDSDTPCLHAKYIESVTACEGEDEMLLAGYSAFEVLKVEKSASPSRACPHKITVRVMPDNKAVPEALPLAKWH